MKVYELIEILINKNLDYEVEIYRVATDCNQGFESFDAEDVEEEGNKILLS